MFEQTDKRAEEGVPDDKTPGSIDRIENPCVIGVRHAVAIFLTDNAMTGICFLYAAAKHRLDFLIGDGYGRIISLEKDVRRSSKMPQREGARGISKTPCKCERMLAWQIAWASGHKVSFLT